MSIGPLRQSYTMQYKNDHTLFKYISNVCTQSGKQKRENVNRVSYYLPGETIEMNWNYFYSKITVATRFCVYKVRKRLKKFDHVQILLQIREASPHISLWHYWFKRRICPPITKKKQKTLRVDHPRPLNRPNHSKFLCLSWKITFFKKEILAAELRHCTSLFRLSSRMAAWPFSINRLSHSGTNYWKKNLRPQEYCIASDVFLSPNEN